MTTPILGNIHWVRCGWSWHGCEAEWRVHTMYDGLVKRLAWTPFGIGPWLMWMPR